MTQQKTPLMATNFVVAAQDNVVFFQQLLTELRVELESERSTLPDSVDVIQDSITETELTLEQVQASINKLKLKSKQRKQEIDEWKRWYGAIAPLNKMPEWETLTQEIMWRSQNISDCEAKISQLESKKLMLMGDLEKKWIQLAAFMNGVYDLPLDEDPRLIEAQSTLKTAQESLQKTQKEPSIGERRMLML